MSKNKNLIENLLFEASSYKSFEDIEQLVEIGTDLSQIPIQPLYVSLLNTSTDQLALIIPKLSKKQRQLIMDLDLWKRDEVDVESFETWIETYSKVAELELTQEFVSSEDFYIYLKSRVNIYTFDVEEPEYPDHDYYFLTDDMLLLVEYSEHYRYPNELKYLIRNLYDLMGVENAYTTLFKLVNDSYLLLEEKGYQSKKERLRDYGFVDYYDALEKLNAFTTIGQLDKYITSKDSLTPDIDLVGQSQSLHSSALTSFNTKMENIYQELNMVSDEKRLRFLHFTFIRLINSAISINDALKVGRVELSRIGNTTRNFLDLGLQYIKIKTKSEESIFNKFDFFDVYKVGYSLIECQKRSYLKALKDTPFESDDYEYFLGAWWCSFLENTELVIPKVKTYGAAMHAKEIDNYQIYEFWSDEVDLLVASIPFVNSFFNMFVKLKEDGKLNNDFYLNYEVENIDFEAIIISSFINYSLGNFSDTNVNKMGITIGELKVFFSKFFVRKQEEYVLIPIEQTEMSDIISKFIKQYGFEQIKGFDRYLYGIISEHLSGYDFDTLEDDDFKHIGGPILLNFTKN